MAGRGQISFHSGSLFAKDPSTNGTIQVATLQEVSFDFKSTNKELFGENQFAEAIGRGNSKISGKAKTGRFNGALLNTVFFAQPASSIATQANLLGLAEAHVVASATVTATNGANFVEDLGISLADGTPLKRVVTVAGADQYSVNETTGVYTVDASLNGSTLKMSYLYKTTATGAGTLTINNQPAGEAPTFRAIFCQKFQSKTLTLILNALVAESLGFGFKMEDFAMPDMAFAAQADTNGVVGSLSMTQFS